MLPIYIPSRSRAGKAVAPKRTLWYLLKVPELRGRIYVVVPKEQQRTYQEAVMGVGADVEVLACPADGISRTRLWCGEHAFRHADQSFLMLDDDLGFLVRRNGVEDWHLKEQCPSETLEMLQYVESLLRRGFGAVGISAREGNNRLVTCPTTNTRIIRALAFRTIEFLNCEHGRVPVMEDFDVLLQLLRRGLPNAVTARYAQGQRQTQEEGGCSDYRSHEVHEKAAERLAELHAPFVRLRTKRNKSGGDFGTRREVTIQWKRAWKSSYAEDDS